jgi:hypothetical protein
VLRDVGSQRVYVRGDVIPVECKRKYNEIVKVMTRGRRRKEIDFEIVLYLYTHWSSLFKLRYLKGEIEFHTPMKVYFYSSCLEFK